MYGIDTILTDEMCRQMTRDLGENAVLSIKEKLFSKYAITLKQSIHEFEKLDDILESIYGKACKKIERNCFENICTAYNFDIQEKNSEYLIFTNNSISKNIFEVFTNEKKKSILHAMIAPNTIKNILEITDIKKTIGYKMINELIQDGFIIKSDDTLQCNMYNAKFESIFENVNIEFNDLDEIKTQVKFKGELFSSSVIPKILSK
jgi:hypothetical protein